MIEIICGLLIAMGIYLILEEELRRRIYGIVLTSTTINIILLYCGRLTNNLPAFIGNNVPANLSNPLPQALILTAIVIGFGLLIFLVVLLKVAQKS